MARRRAGSKALIKDINKILVLSTIREQGPVSRTELAQLTGLNASTISKICDDLHKRDMLFDVGAGQSSGGRRPIQMLFNNNLGYIIVVKIEDARIRLALANLKPSIMDDYSIPFQRGGSYPETIGLIKTEIQKLRAKLDAENKELMGVGVALSGIVHHNQGKLMGSTFLGWAEEDIAGDLAEVAGAPVYVDNDINCYALAQHWLGSGKGESNMLCLTIGQGIGGGLVLENKLYRGNAGGAGEIGHMICEQGGRRCYCGQEGCLEGYCSYPALRKDIQQELGLSLTMEEIAQKAQSGHTGICQLLEQAGKRLGSTLISLCMCIAPELIIIGGEGITKLPSYMDGVNKQFGENWFSRSGMSPIPVLFDEPGNRFFLLGTALLVVDRLFGAPLFEEDNPLLRESLSSTI
ncbi:MAG: ROK family protein [Spirochaetales bacterium]|nr:ROK family protein [Spirochaetales bacterium]